MNTVTLITLSPDELQQLIANAISQALSNYLDTIATPNSKLLFTVKEVCEQTGYKSATVRRFIRDGRRTRAGSIVRLPAVEITTGEYRVRPDDLANWVKRF